MPQMVLVLQHFQKNTMKKNKPPGDNGENLPVNPPPPEKKKRNEGAEKYLGELADIEDLPDPEQVKEAEESEKKKKST
jgi:hypothetical protein